MVSLKKKKKGQRRSTHSINLRLTNYELKFPFMPKTCIVVKTFHNVRELTNCKLRFPFVLKTCFRQADNVSQFAVVDLDLFIFYVLQWQLSSFTQVRQKETWVETVFYGSGNEIRSC